MSIVLDSKGSSFQRRSSETAKALSPYDLVLVAITSKYPIEDFIEDFAQMLTCILLIFAFKDLKLQPEESFVLKIVQLEELLAVRHSVFVIGAAGTGKTQVTSSALEFEFTLQSRFLQTAHGIR